jgi:hypothetical protein
MATAFPRNAAKRERAESNILTAYLAGWGNLQLQENIL